MYEKRESKSLNLRIAKFVQQGEDKHGIGSYDYSIARREYKNNRTPVHINCNSCNHPPFKVYPFAHTDKGDNKKGTCPHCYVPKQGVKETRWDPNLPERRKEFVNRVNKKYEYSLHLPYVEEEYRDECSEITVVCKKCQSKEFTRLARSLKTRNRKGGCPECNKKEMAETIRKKNKERQLRNYQIKDLPQEYGCIYKITNTKNGKFYIGYTNMTAERRFKSHVDETRRMQKGKKGRSSYFHNAMNYHGIECFKVEILEEHRDVTPHFLAKLEMEYIAKMKPHYNVSPGGEIGRSKIHCKKAS